MKNTKYFKGKAIYNPSGKAAEYSKWACNFYKGCSNGCTYCYLKKGVLAHAMGGDMPELKACFKDEKHAMEVFESELSFNIVELQKKGLFFTFTSDPMLPETIDLTFQALNICYRYDVPCKILTKCADWVSGVRLASLIVASESFKRNTAFGFSLTGHDELEPGASTNNERIEAMKKLHEAGFKTWASIEPIIDFESSFKMIEKTLPFCDLYKIGLESGKKYDKKEAIQFVVDVFLRCRSAVYIKDSLLKLVGDTRDSISVYSHAVTRKYNIFTGGDECLEECTGCDKKFDIEDMESDSGGNLFCPECWKELSPVMKVEYEELKSNMEIE